MVARSGATEDLTGSEGLRDRLASQMNGMASGDEAGNMQHDESERGKKCVTILRLLWLRTTTHIHNFDLLEVDSEAGFWIMVFLFG